MHVLWRGVQPLAVGNGWLSPLPTPFTKSTRPGIRCDLWYASLTLELNGFPPLWMWNDYRFYLWEVLKALNVVLLPTRKNNYDLWWRRFWKAKRNYATDWNSFQLSRLPNSPAFTSITQSCPLPHGADVSHPQVMYLTFDSSGIFSPS